MLQKTNKQNKTKNLAQSRLVRNEPKAARRGSEIRCIETKNNIRAEKDVFMRREEEKRRRKKEEEKKKKKRRKKRRSADSVKTDETNKRHQFTNSCDYLTVYCTA